jgi:hypothetical protein
VGWRWEELAGLSRGRMRTDMYVSYVSFFVHALTLATFTMHYAPLESFVRFKACGTFLSDFCLTLSLSATLSPQQLVNLTLALVAMQGCGGLRTKYWLSAMQLLMLTMACHARR